ncbi:membrane protein [Fulvitalea axinellae]|uniref:Membrane protein n=1 Tax=Fulvitalea axinellae TaxID=1182444 RepID=A0AAU9CF25_9BACT|nr:membrane protein [Fulvitalea axinellae]
MNKETLRIVREYSIITVGIMLFVLGWGAFVIPSNISGGGVSGISILVYQVTGIPVSYTYLLANVALLAVGIRHVGKAYGLKIVYGVLLGSIMFWLVQQFITEPVVDERFMAAIIGGVISGIGAAMVLAQGGSLGGTDILATIIMKYRNASPGKLLLYMDMVIIGASFFVFRSPTAIVYASVVMVSMTYVVDSVLTGRNASVQLFIFSNNFEPIAKRIEKEVDRGLTILDGTGWYSQEKKKIIMVIVRKSEYSRVLSIAKHEDPDAFVSVANVVGVYGQGFDQIKN